MSTNALPQLTPASLFQRQAALDELKVQVYNRILSAAHQRIKFAASRPNSDQITWYEVPEWQMGCPSYDVKDCILYIVWHLRSSGFHVAYVSPNRLIISWKEHSIQYYKEESPIRQAMLAATSSTSRRSTTVASEAAAVAAPAGKKKAAAYKPMPDGVAGMLAKGGSTRATETGKVTFI